MSLSSGTRLGSYEVVAQIGAGGMGEVYRARDTKLGRSVAVKVLPDAFVSDVERISRFEREAKALAALNHPHVAVLYGMEQSEGRHFLVMELVEGDTLADRLQRGALSIESTLMLAIQIADALEAAHEKGIVHRDLKPANVKITPDEKVKVLDFGLAKALEDERTPSNLTHSPTLSLMATQAGVILGTAAYMSPEQAKGLPADQRSDVFAFGIVLYEMLTGRQPFHGETAPDVLASILVREADLRALPSSVNPRLVDLVRRCLEKQPKKRWQAIGDVRAELETIRQNPQAVPIAAPRLPAWKRAVGPVVVSALAGAALATLAMWLLGPSAHPPVTRFAITLPEGQQFTNVGRQLVASSPDGSRIVYVANQRLFLRTLGDLEARPILGTDTLGSVANPVFSPDGASIAFFATIDRTIKRISITGGAAATICPVAQGPFGMSWAKEGLVFGQGNDGIMRVAPGGGKPEQIVKVATGELAHGPQLLPGGSLLFTLATGANQDRWEKASIIALTPQGERRTLIEGGTDARYLTTGHLVYALGGVIFAVPFDVASLRVTGEPAPVIEGVRRAAVATTGSAQFIVSDAGSLVYVPGPASLGATQTIVGLFDSDGRVEPLKAGSGAYLTPRISPDGTRASFSSDDGQESAIWISDVSGTSVARRLTFGGHDRFPAWSHDGRRIVFQSDVEGGGLFWQLADGTDKAERLTRTESGTSHIPNGWSPDGQHLLVDVVKGSTFTLSVFTPRDKSLTQVDDIVSFGTPTGAEFSPDGRWIAYSVRDRQRGNNILYVEPFPATGAKYQISKDADDGHHPVWSPDGKELIFVPGPGRFVRVPITLAPAFSVGDPVAINANFSRNAPTVARTFDIMPDGKRFLGLTDAASQSSSAGDARAPASPEIRVVLNWFEELKQRVPVR